jgi:dTDP-4-dehydrorhamnose reductase
MSYSSFELLDHSQPILIFGRDGQVGKALQQSLGDFQVPVIYLGRKDCDLSDESSLNGILNRYQPQLIINAAAYTAVDQAESERDLAIAINAKAPQIMANYIAHVAHGILVHYSTDYVFADTKTTAYQEVDPPGPMKQLSVYGQSKWLGEQAIEQQFNLDKYPKSTADQTPLGRYFILRTSWVYGDGDNFIRTMLRLAAERDNLRVVADQIGVPTSAQWLAEIGIQMAGSRLDSGVYHAVPGGETSWHGLAVFAIETAVMAGEGIDVKVENILPITSEEYPVAAKRPMNSRLSNQKLKNALSEMAYTSAYPNWQEQVEAYVKDYVARSLKS